MTLAAALQDLAHHPASIRSRCAVAQALEENDPAGATLVWAAAVRHAAGRGNFFLALSLCRRHFDDEAMRPLLAELGRRYGAMRHPARRPIALPIPQPNTLTLPPGLGALRILAVKLGIDLTDVCLPDDAEVPEIPLFDGLAVGPFVTLARSMEAVPLEPGQSIAVQGTTDQDMYLLAFGEAEVRQDRPDGKQITLTTLEAPVAIGEMSLLTHVPRRASIVATTPGLAWRIDATILERIARIQPSLITRLSDLVKRRLLQNLAHSSEVLGLMGGGQAVLSAFELLTLPQGTEVFAAGVQMPGLYFVLHGEAEVFAPTPSGGEERVAVLTEGDTFGEMSLLTGAPTSAAIRLPHGGSLLHLPAAVFHAQRKETALQTSLSDIADVRRGQLESLFRSTEADYEKTEAAWFL